MLLRNLICRSFLFCCSLVFINNTDAQPKISSFAPASGPVGTAVTINGSGFSSTAANNTVYFGAVRATVSAATATTISATVPTGANYDKVTVTVNGLTAYSIAPFNVTYTGGGSITNGTFFSFSQYTTDLHPNGLAVYDFDGDGKPDVITPNNYSTTGQPASISILRNTSTGGSISFAPKADINNGVATYAIAAGDLDGDGKKDVVVNSIADQNLSIFRNTSVSGTISFAAKVDLPATGSVYGIEINDMDGDGKPDLVVVNGLANNFSVYRNTSSGPGNISFAAKADFPAGTFPRNILVADFDGDGLPDVAVSNNLSYNFVILRNTSTAGNVSFNTLSALVISLGAGNQADGMTAADLDGDGKQDLAVVASLTPSNTNFLQVYRNTSNGANINMASAVSFQGGNNSGYHVAAGDINGDGKPDLVYGITNNDQTKVYQNNSTPGSIQMTEAAQANGFSPYGMNLSDLDGDSRPDLITSHFSSDQVFVFKNGSGVPRIISFLPTTAGTGSTVTITGYYFTGATAVSFGGTPAQSFTVISPTQINAVVGTGSSGDVVVTTPQGTATASGFIYDASPRIQSFAPSIGTTGTVVTITGINLSGVTAVSFGGVNAASFSIVDPTKITAVVAGGATGKLKLTYPSGNDSLPGFIYTAAPVITSVSPEAALPGTQVTITGYNFNPLASGNIVYFGDVRAAVVSATSTSIMATVPVVASAKSISVTTNRLTAYSPKPFIFKHPSPGSISGTTFNARTDLGLIGPSYGLDAADLDNDGRTDVAACALNGNLFSFFRNAGSNGTLSFSASLDSAASGYPQDVKIADVDGDGLKDPMVINYGMRIYPNKSTSGTVILGPGQSFDTNGLPPSFSTGDLNADGKPDLAVANYINLAILTNSSTASAVAFDAPRDFAGAGQPQDVALADFDSDGKPDAAVIYFQSNSVRTFRNITDKNGIDFVTVNDFVTLDQPYDITAPDVDGDGRPDIVLTQLSSDRVSIFRNTTTNGVLTFSNRIDIGSGAGPRGVIFGDVNGDGKADMLVVNSYSNSFSLYQNTSVPGTIAFAGRVDISTGAFPQRAVFGDFDGDGKLDVAVSSYSGKAVSIHLNTTSALTVLSFTPATGTTGTTVTINGTNFTGATAVSFGGVAASSFTVVNANTITAVVAGGASGNVSVTTPSGTAFKSGFVYTLPTGVGSVNANNSKELLVSPDPVRDIMLITHPVSSQVAQLQLIGMNGQVVLTTAASRNQPRTTVSLKALPAGVYKLVWSDGKTLLRRTIMKVN